MPNLCWFASLFFMFCGCSCQQKVKSSAVNFSRADTIAVIQTALEDPKLDSVFKIAWNGQKLKLVRNEVVKTDYDIIYHGKHIPIVTFDSAYHNPANEATRFFGVVSLFRKISKDQAKVVLVFHGIGVVADFKAAKSNGKWQITNRVFGRT